LVKPEKRLNLAAIDSNEKALIEEASKDDHLPHFEVLQTQLQQLQKKLYAQNKHRLLIVMQAMDTGGKDGCIKHVFSRIDPQGIHVRSFKKPTEEELARDFLWRIHSRVPRSGEMVIFNRSHYEDVIAVRVKKIFPDKVWQRRVRHIIEFERMLAEEGTTIIKIYLHISKDEQKSRLQARLDQPHKHWKFNPADLEDRARWDDFMHAYEDLLSDTSTPHAPWYVVPANRKWYRNLCVARIVMDTMKRLNLEFPPIDWDPKEMRIED
jgi:PPK2 family polyphosphate:nucleotide phosphotransferase